MALGITLTVGGTTYRLQATKIMIRLSRNPIQAALPGGIDPLLLDLGQFRPSMVIEGAIKSVEPLSDGGISIPTKRQLEDLTSDNFASTITVSVSVGGISDDYVGKIANLSFTLPAARDDLWEYVMNLVTVGRINTP